jgi:signal peptide peptidase SppA
MNPNHGLEHLAAWMIDTTWATTEPMMHVIATVFARRLAGRMPDADLRAQAASTTRRPVSSAPSAVAVLPIHGVIAPRMNLLSDVSGGTSYQALGAALASAVADPAVKSIVLDVDSPGGSVAGAPEFATALLKAREKKPITAVAAFQMCSAAYWLGACCTEIVASESSHVGSIGVLTIHQDLSKAFEQLGVKHTLLSAGKYKTAGNPYEPLSPEARALIQKQIDRGMGMFVRDVAAGRRVSEAAVRGGFGQGAIVNADDALRLGMIDRVEALDETLARVAAQPPSLTPVRSSVPAAAARRLPAPAAAFTRPTLAALQQQVLDAAAGGRVR